MQSVEPVLENAIKPLGKKIDIDPKAPRMNECRSVLELEDVIIPHQQTKHNMPRCQVAGALDQKPNCSACSLTRCVVFRIRLRIQ